jgi:hypothetical protein
VIAVEVDIASQPVGRIPRRFRWGSRWICPDLCGRYGAFCRSLFRHGCLCVMEGILEKDERAAPGRKPRTFLTQHPLSLCFPTMHGHRAICKAGRN